jgi:dTDP-4-dehydrorhamnose reductase
VLFRSRQQVDYTRWDALAGFLREKRPELLINAAGYTGKPNVDACETTREETLFANTLLPQTVARVCLLTNTPWGHVSSGGIYTGAKIIEGGKMRVIRDLNQPEIRRLFEQSPERLFGFTEWDEPNFSFRHAPCNFYSGTKALAEEAICGIGQSYIWRPATPFGEQSVPRNFLWKLQHYPKVYDAIASLSHLDDFVRASLDLWEYHAPFGIYNMTNPGAVATRQVIEMIQQILDAGRAAPNGCNLNLVRFIVIKDPEEAKMVWSDIPTDHAVIIVICFDERSRQVVGQHLSVPQNAGYDAAAAADHMLLMAHALGLGGIWLTRTEESAKKFKEQYGLPDYIQVALHIAVGWPAIGTYKSARMPLQEMILTRKKL